MTNAAIDCDLHPAVPGVATLLPYMDEYWRHTLVERGIEVLESASYPPNAPTTARPGTTPAGGGPPGSDLALIGAGRRAARRPAWRSCRPRRWTAGVRPPAS